MSCGQPSQEDEQSENIPILPPPSATCVRCGQAPKIVVRATAWCHDCFLASFQGRFRKSLEGAKLVAKNGFATYKGEKTTKENKKKELSNVVLAFSGGSSSRAMLELFKTSYYKRADLVEPTPESEPTSEPTEVVTKEGELEGEVEVKKTKKKGPKKQFFPPAFAKCRVVFIDESELPGFGPDKTEEIRQIVESTTPFEFHPLKLSSIFTSSSPSLSISTSSPTLPSHTSSSSSSPSTSLDKLLSLLHPTIPLPPTTYSTLHQTLVHSLLLESARDFKGCDVLLLGDNSTRLGIKTISSMAQGRGYSLGEEISIEYIQQQHAGEGEGPSREGHELLICRPMGASLAKEVGYYTKSEGLETVLVTNEDTSLRAVEGEGEGKVVVEKDIKKVGIGKLVEDFVLNLEAQFPSTVSIITKTAHKLGMKSADIQARGDGTAVNNCVLCEMPAQVDAEGWNRSITISDLQAARQALSKPALPTSLENSSPTSTATGVKKREPYQPSKNYLLPQTITSDQSNLENEPQPEVTRPNTTQESSEETFSLSPHLCYACLLLLQTSKSNHSKKGRVAEKTDGEIELPPYVLENVERRRERGTTMKEVKGQEGMRKEIQEYLLD